MKRNRSFDVLKGVACLFVIANHFDWSAAEYDRLGFAFWLYLPIPLFMMISGYVGALSAERRGGTLAAQYHPAFLAGRLLRFLLPYSAAFLIEQFYCVVKLGRRTAAPALLKLFITGGIGPGSYYTPIILQFVFVFPLLFIIIKRKAFRGLLICGGINIAYEVLKLAFGMSEGLYRLLVFRYILLIAFGCYLALFPEERIALPIRLGSFAAGVLFIIAYQYLGWQPVLFGMWTYTSMPVALYTMPVFEWIVRRCRLRCRPLELLGIASYNSYLAQMVYYSFGMDFVYLHIAGRWVRLVANLVICAAAGILFHRLESPVTGRLIRSLQRRSDSA